MRAKGGKQETNLKKRYTPCPPTILAPTPTTECDPCTMCLFDFERSVDVVVSHTSVEVTLTSKRFHANLPRHAWKVAETSKPRYERLGDARDVSRAGQACMK